MDAAESDLALIASKELANSSQIPPASPAESSEQPSVSSETTVSSETGFDQFDEDQALEILEAWMLSQPYYARRMLAVLLAEMFRRRYELKQGAAAQEAAVITGWSDQTVRRFRKEFFANRGELKVGRGISSKLKGAPKKSFKKSGGGKEKPKVVGHRKPRKK